MRQNAAKCGDEGGTKIEKSRISSSDFSEVEITTNNGIAKTKPNAAVITHPSSLFETERSGHAPALNPHRPTPLPAQTPPAVSSLEAFRTPASVHPVAPAPGRRPHRHDEADTGGQQRAAGDHRRDPSEGLQRHAIPLHERQHRAHGLTSR
jgi:hypothetical protein